MVTVRTAIHDDKLKVAIVHVRSWQVGYRGIIADDVLDRLKPEDRAARYTFGETEGAAQRTFVATEDDEIVGFVTIGAADNGESPHEGEVFALYVDPDFWGRRIGQALILRARQSLHDMSFTNASLWVLEGNRRAERFYEADGWVMDGTSRDDVAWGVVFRGNRFKRSLQ